MKIDLVLALLNPVVRLDEKKEGEKNMRLDWDCGADDGNENTNKGEATDLNKDGKKEEAVTVEETAGEPTKDDTLLNEVTQNILDSANASLYVTHPAESMTNCSGHEDTVAGGESADEVPGRDTFVSNAAVGDAPADDADSVDVDLSGLDACDDELTEKNFVAECAFIVDFVEDEIVAGEVKLNVVPGKDFLVFEQKSHTGQFEKFGIEYRTQNGYSELYWRNSWCREGVLENTLVRQRLNDDIFWSRSYGLCEGVLSAFRSGWSSFHAMSESVSAFPLIVEIRRDPKIVEMATTEPLFYEMAGLSKQEAALMPKAVKRYLSEIGSANEKLLKECAEFLKIGGASAELWQVAFGRGFLMAAYRHIDDVCSLLDPLRKISLPMTYRDLRTLMDEVFLKQS